MYVAAVRSRDACRGLPVRDQRERGSRQPVRHGQICAGGRQFTSQWDNPKKESATIGRDLAPRAGLALTQRARSAKRQLGGQTRQNTGIPLGSLASNELGCRARELKKRGRKLRVQQQPIQILSLLVVSTLAHGDLLSAIRGLCATQVDQPLRDLVRRKQLRDLPPASIIGCRLDTS